MQLLRRIGTALLFTSLIFNVRSFAQTSVASLSPANSAALSLLQASRNAHSGDVTVEDVTLTGTCRSWSGDGEDSGTITMMAAMSGSSRVDLGNSSGRVTEFREI